MREAARIRRATRADVPAMLALEALFPSDRMSARSMRRFIASDRAYVLVAARDGEILGDLVLLMRRNSTRARIYSVVVSPAARGLGLGSRMVRKVEQWARSEKCTCVGLEVREDNAAARALYEKLGYRVTQTLPAYYDDGADGQRLERSLTEN